MADRLYHWMVVTEGPEVTNGCCSTVEEAKKMLLMCATRKGLMFDLDTLFEEYFDAESGVMDRDEVGFYLAQNADERVPERVKQQADIICDHIERCMSDSDENNQIRMQENMFERLPVEALLPLIDWEEDFLGRNRNVMFAIQIFRMEEVPQNTLQVSGSCRQT